MVKLSLLNVKVNTGANAKLKLTLHISRYWLGLGKNVCNKERVSPINIWHLAVTTITDLTYICHCDAELTLMLTQS